MISHSAKLTRRDSFFLNAMVSSSVPCVFEGGSSGNLEAIPAKERVRGNREVIGKKIGNF